MAKYSWHNLAKLWRAQERERVVLWKADSGGAAGGSQEAALPIYEPNRDPESKNLKRPQEGRRMTATKPKKLKAALEEIGKRDAPGAIRAAARKDLVEAVIAKAYQRAIRKGTRPDVEEAKLWQRIYRTPQFN